MKKLLCCLLSVSICFMLVACGKGPTPLGGVSKGVPESLVLRNTPIEDNMTYEINHHYDSSTHIDDIELITSYKGAFGVQTKTYTYAYQYDKNSDLWSLISDDDGLQSDVTSLDPKAYIGKSFEGRFEHTHSGEYQIAVRDLDLSNETITIDYLLIFDNQEVFSSTAETVSILPMTNGELGFTIEYSWSIVRFFVPFWLDLLEGVSAEE